MTESQAEAQRMLEKYGSRAKAAQAMGLSKTGFRQRLIGATEARTSGRPVTDNDAGIEVTPASGGFSIAGRTLLASKPTDIWKARFFALRAGMGYTIDHLADQWGNSHDTIKSNAKRFGALRYVEDAERPGNYVACVVHPDTPKGR